MKISEAIEILEAIKNEDGDLDLVSFEEIGDEQGEVEYGRTFGVLEVAIDDKDPDKMHTVCAFMRAEEIEIGPGESLSH